VEPLDDHLNGNKGTELHFKQKTTANYKKIDVRPDGLPFDKSRRNKINIVNMIN
jgi:hypothetical protein